MIPLSPRSVSDRISMFSRPADIREPMVAVVDAVQTLPPEIQLLAIGTALTCLSEAIGLDVREVLRRVDRMKNDVDSPWQKQFRAMSEYAKGELLKP